MVREFGRRNWGPRKKIIKNKFFRELGALSKGLEDSLDALQNPLWRSNKKKIVSEDLNFSLQLTVFGQKIPFFGYDSEFNG